MSENPYKTPEAQLTNDVDVSTQRLYVVSKKKLIILFLALGGYNYLWYWFYVQWRDYKQVDGKTRWPLVRGFFYYLFAYSFFRKLDVRYEFDRRQYSWSPIGFASVLFLSLIVDLIIDFYDGGKTGSYKDKDVYSMRAHFAFLVINLYVVVKVQSVINFTQGDPHGTSNDRLTAINYFWIAVGLALWILVIGGMADALGLITFD